MQILLGSRLLTSIGTTHLRAKPILCGECCREGDSEVRYSPVIRALELTIQGLPRAPKSVLERAHSLIQNDSLRTTASNFVL